MQENENLDHNINVQVICFNISYVAKQNMKEIEYYKTVIIIKIKEWD